MNLKAFPEKEFLADFKSVKRFFSFSETPRTFANAIAAFN